MEWRIIWIGIAIITLLFLPIFSYHMVKDINIFSRDKDYYNKINTKIKNWTRKEVLLDFKFYTMLPALLAPAAIITGIFVYQSFIVESKRWGIYVLPTAFMVYSITSVVILFASGYLVDKFSSSKILPFLNLPLLFSLIVLIFYNHHYSAYIIMFFVGATNGLANVLLSSLWAEIYGVRHLGAIRFPHVYGVGLLYRGQNIFITFINSSIYFTILLIAQVLN